MHIKSPLFAPAKRVHDQLDDLQLCQSLKAALGLRFNLRTEQFQFQAHGQALAVEISEDALLVLISSTLAQQPELFRPSQIRPRRLKQIIHLLRALCADADDAMQRGLRQFVMRRLQRRPGEVTNSEIRTAYETEANRIGEGVMSQHEFHRRLPRLIKATFGLSKLHEIERPNSEGRMTQRNGWRGLALTDTTDTTDSILTLAPEQSQTS